MKKFLLVLLLVTSSLPLLIAQNKVPTPKTSGEYIDIGASLPRIKAVDGKLKVYTAADFMNHHNFFVFLFNPTCGHCINMTKMIGKNSEVFKNNHILFLANSQMLPYFPEFLKETDIYKHPEFVVAVDSSNFIDVAYSYHVLPQINVYDKSRKLIKTFTGDTPLDSLKVYAK